MNNIKISVIIPCYSMERFQDVCDAVASVQKQTLKPYEIIIVVDHNLQMFNKLREIFPETVKVVLNEEERGASASKSLGAHISKGDVVVYLDDDAVADVNWLNILLRGYQDPEVIAVGGKAVPNWVEKHPDWIPEELYWIVGCTHKGPDSKTNEVRNMIGCNMSFRRQVFGEIGYFSNSIARVGKVQGAGEEAEICLRIKRKFPFKRIINHSDAVIYHRVPPKRTSFKYLIQRSYNEGLYKVVMQRLIPVSKKSPLSTENSYLRFLLFSSIPNRILRFYKKGSLAGALGIMACITAVGVGSLKGRMQKMNTIVK